MADDSTEQDRTETATPFKLNRARQRGMIARGRDLGFVSTLVAFAIVAETQGTGFVAHLTQMMRISLSHDVSMGANPAWVAHAAGRLAETLAIALLLPMGMIMAITIAVEVIQNRGVTLSWEPLRPDFTRINPATGLKRFFSMRLLKEAGKNVLKFAIYGIATTLFLINEAHSTGPAARNGWNLALVTVGATGRLLLMFILIAAGFAALDQVLSRGEFARQMRMSRRELTREAREREGEPRFKKKRRQVLTQIIEQARAATDVRGADVIITNPTHYAVALRYRPEIDAAPVIKARGRNAWALRMREAAKREGIVIIRNPSLARELYHEAKLGQTVGRAHYVAVADVYIALRRSQQGRVEAE